jgi:3-hydroxyisobutyrate dehydrogenase
MTLAVGFIGLGAMGRGMAGNLQRAGLLRCIWNRTHDRAAELAAELGCVAAASPAELAAQCNVVVLCVSADADVLQVVDAMAPALGPDSIVIDCSTVAASTAREAARRLAARKVEFLDAPVSGGVEGARDGTLAIMVGGADAAFERAKPVLAAMGRAVTHFGPSGAGQAAKATNQIMCAGIIQAVAEAMAFAKAEGLPLEALIETLGKGAGSSWYFVNRAPNMVRNAYPPGFRVRLHEKDLRICNDMAARHGVQLPVVETTLVHYRTLIEQGFGDDDISTIFRLKDAMFASTAPEEPGQPDR